MNAPGNAPLRVVAVMEAYTVTGPAKNLIRFCRLAHTATPAVEVSIATFYRLRPGEPRSHASNAFIDAARAGGIPVDVIFERRRFDRAVIGQLARILRARDADIVQTHGVKAHFLVWAARLNRGRRWIAFHHGYTAENLKTRLYNKLNRLTLPAADRVVAVCRAFAADLERQGVSRAAIEVLPNSIELSAEPAGERSDGIRQRFAIPEDARIILSVGRFSSEKGHIDLVPAAVRLAQLVPGLPFRFLLAGDGIERPNVERAARAAAVADRFIFAGHQADVRAFYAAADVFVLPSYSEGSPNVVLEAMAAGLPIAATAVGGVPDTVTDGESALIAPAGAPERMAAVLARLLTEPELAARLAACASAELVERFSPAAYQRSLIGIYRRVSACQTAGAA